MSEDGTLAQRFETHRQHLEAVALRMLGTTEEAEDAVQEAWLRLSRSEDAEVRNLGGWLTTVVARVCLDKLRSRASRREDALSEAEAETPAGGGEPDAELELADSVSLALLVVLEHLGPAERVAFVLHDVFDVPFEEIAPIVGRSLDATRQLASRARRRVRGASALSDADFQRQRAVVEAFLAAARKGDFDALIAVLDPDVVLRADPAAVEAAAASRGAFSVQAEIRGAPAVAGVFRGRARAARVALIGDRVGAAFAPDGTPRAAMSFTIERGRITFIEIVADASRIRDLSVSMLQSAP
jgi:RNA polymerase sigma-70 factor (ECF subfamily)